MLDQDLNQTTSPTFEERRAQALERAQESQAKAQEIAQARLQSFKEADTRSWLTDVGVGVVGGVRDGVGELLDWTASADEWLITNVGAPKLTDSGLSWSNNPEDFSRITGEALPEAPETETVVGGITKGVAQYLTGFALTRRVNPFKATSTFGKTAKLTTESAVTDAIFFDPHEARLANLVDEHTEIKSPIIDYLKASPEDSEAEGRFKNALEGLGIGAAFDGLAKSLKFLKESYDGVRLANGLEGMDESIFKEAEQFRNIVQKEAEKPVKVEAKEMPKEQPKDAPTDTQKPQEGDVDSPPPTDKPEPIFLDTVKESLKMDQDALDALKTAIAKGEFSQADELIDFNPNTIAWDKIESADDIADMLNTVSDTLANTIDDAKGGVQTWAQTKALANLVGGDPKKLHELYSAVRGNGGITPRILAARRTLLASAQRTVQLSQEARRTNADADILAFQRQVELHGAIQAQVTGVKTEVARAMNAMKILADANKSANDLLAKATGDLVTTGRGRNVRPKGDSTAEITRDALREASAGTRRKNGRQLADVLAQMSDLAEINKTIRKSRYARARDIFIEHYINGLLSSLRTLSLNNISNTLKVVEGVSERYVAAGIGAVRKVFGSKADINTIREANAFTYGTIEGLRDSLKVPMKSLLDEARKNGFGNMKEVIQANEDKWGSAFRAWVKEQPILDKKTRFEESRKAIHVDDQTMRNYGPASRAWAKTWNAYGNLIRLPSRDIMASDEIFKSMAYRQELRALAYREADAMATSKGLTGDARQKYMAEEIGKILKDPPEELHLGSIDFARYQTFQSELGNLGKSLEELRAKFPLMSLVIPFVRTPINIMKQGLLERSPIALLRSQLWRDIKNGGREADMAVARLTMGVSLWTTGFMLAAEGRITGGQKYDRTGAVSGEVPYSIRIGDTYYQYNRLEPMGMLLGTAADAYQISTRGLSPENASVFDDAREAAVVGITAVSENVLSKTWMMGVADTLDAFTDTERNLESWITRMSGSMVPYSSFLRSTTQEVDPIAREAFTYIDSIKRGIPGLSDELPEKRDYLGRVKEHPERYGPEAVSPIVIGKGPDSPIDKELSRMDFEFQMPQRSIMGVPLTAKQYSRLLELRGQEITDRGKNLEETLNELVQSPEYQRLKDSPIDLEGGKEFIIKKYVSRFTTAARKKLIEEDPELYRKIEEAQRRENVLLQAQ